MLPRHRGDCPAEHPAERGELGMRLGAPDRGTGRLGADSSYLNATAGRGRHPGRRRCWSTDRARGRGGPGAGCRSIPARGDSRSREAGPPRAFAIATSTGRPGSSFATPKASRPGQGNGRSSPAWNPPRRQGCGQTETQVVVPVIRLVPVTVRRAAVLGVVVPAPAPDDPVRGLGRPPKAIVKSCSASANTPSNRLA